MKEPFNGYSLTFGFFIGAITISVIGKHGVIMGLITQIVLLSFYFFTLWLYNLKPIQRTIKDFGLKKPNEID